jgi:hypothetical protein
VAVVGLAWSWNGAAPPAPAPASPQAVVLAPVADGGSTVTLTWTGPTHLDYAVEVTRTGEGAADGPGRAVGTLRRPCERPPGQDAVTFP